MRIEYWPTSEGVHVVQIDPDHRVTLLRVMFICKQAARLLGTA